MMKIVRAVARGVLLSALAVAASGMSWEGSAPEGSATPSILCPICVTMEGGGGGYGHSFQSGGYTYACEPNSCHINWQSGTCSCCHGSCYLVEDVKDAVAAARVGDNSTMLKTGAITQAAQIRYNAKRQAIQVVGCDGNVIAHFPVTTRAAAILSAD
jgi:transcription elongation factor